jgi:putative IMPACT (imprinted ancient) family translation regulator
MYGHDGTAVSTILKHDNDDDGEDAAGGKLAQLLQMRNEDGVLVVVSRWYGGIQLGPRRFAIITNVAREGLVQYHDKQQQERSSTATTSKLSKGVRTRAK